MRTKKGIFQRTELLFGREKMDEIAFKDLNNSLTVVTGASGTVTKTPAFSAAKAELACRHRAGEP